MSKTSLSLFPCLALCCFEHFARLDIVISAETTAALLPGSTQQQATKQEDEPESREKEKKQTTQEECALSIYLRADDLEAVIIRAVVVTSSIALALGRGLSWHL